MGLFDKKYCDICGEKIGLLGNRKLDDGNLCKNCAAKLSPWFSERRQSTVAQIREQLEYREANKAKVAEFRTTRSLGRDVKILLDEDNMKFMITGARNLAEANPDVVDFTSVTGCDLDVRESRTEEFQTERMKDGSTRRVPYNPPRYITHYDFHMIIRVNCEYFDDMTFRLNNTPVTIHSTGAGIVRGGFGGPSVKAGFGRAQAVQASNNDPMMNPDYAEFYNMGMEIKEILMNSRNEARETIAAANAPKQAMNCPNCGATTIPDANGCCEYCGSAIC